MNKRYLIVILVLALAVRLQLLLEAPETRLFLTEDSQSYSRLASGMLSWGVFGEAGIGIPPRLSPEIFRTPGYPAFILLNNLPVGVRKPDVSTFGGELQEWEIRCSVVCQISLDVILVCLTCLLGTRLAGVGAGYVAGFLQALSPLAIASSCRILSDSLYAFVFTSAILFMIAHLRRGRWWTLFASAVALGAASYVRPVGLAMAPIFALAVLLRRGQNPGSETAARVPGVDDLKPEGLGFISPGRSPGEGSVREGEPCKGEATPLPRPFRASAEQGPPTQGFALGCRTGAFQAPDRNDIAACRPGGPGWLTRALARLAKSAVFLAVFAACIAPWVIRNGLRADYWGFSSSYGDTLYQFAAPEVLLRAAPHKPRYYPATNRDPEMARYEDLQEIWRYELSVTGGRPEETTDLSPGELARRHMATAVDVILAHPWTYAKLHAKGSIAFWLPATDALEIAGLTEGGKGTLEVLREKGLWPAVRNYFGDNWKAYALAVPILLFTLIQYLAAARCAALGIRRTRFRLPAEIWMLILIVLVSAAMPGVVAHPRFRVPIEPILNVAAAAGLVAIFRKKEVRD